MKLLRGINSTIKFDTGSVVAIGNFDGVHRGHQALLRLLHEKAKNLKLPLVVVLFEPQPSEFFLGCEAPARITQLREKLAIFQMFHVDYVYCLNFNKHLAQMEPTEFAEQIVYSFLKAKYLLIGEDFRFGRARQGDVVLLKKLSEKWSCTVEAYPSFLVNEERVSSTRIRRALQLADFNQVTELLGRPYSMCGRVVHGNALGRTWGIPTANINVHRYVVPLKGIYCVQIKCEGHPLLNGVASIGTRPTLDETKNLLEVHLFDFNRNLYGEMLEVFFLHKLREEEKFPSLDALIAQIHADVAVAKVYFTEKRECLTTKIH